MKTVLILLLLLSAESISQELITESGEPICVWHDLGYTVFYFGGDRWLRGYFHNCHLFSDHIDYCESLYYDARCYYDGKFKYFNKNDKQAKYYLNEIVRWKIDSALYFPERSNRYSEWKRIITGSYEILKNIALSEKYFKNALALNDLEYESSKRISFRDLEAPIGKDLEQYINENVIYSYNASTFDKYLAFDKLQEYYIELQKFSAVCFYNLGKYDTVITVSSKYINDNSMTEMFVKSMIKKFKLNPLKEELSKEMKTLTIMAPEDTADAIKNKDVEIPFNGSININLFNVPVKITDNKISKLQSDFRQNKITYLEANKKLRRILKAQLLYQLIMED